MYRMSTTALDSRGRLTVRKEHRERLGDRFVQIMTPHGLLLRPVEDTLEDAGDLPPALQASGEDVAREEADR